MCPYARDGEDGSGPLSNVGINNVPRHHRLDSSPYHSVAARHGPEILRSMSGQPGGSGRFLESEYDEPLLCILCSFDAAFGLRHY